MRRLVAIVTAVSFGLAAPAFAQTAPAIGSSQPTENSQAAQPLLLDGQDAMAQNCPPGDTSCGFWNNNGVWVVVGVGLAIGGIVWAISESHKHSVSP